MCIRDSYSSDEGEPDTWQEEVDSLMKDLSLFRRRVQDDHSRFGKLNPCEEASV